MKLLLAKQTPQRAAIGTLSCFLQKYKNGLYIFHQSKTLSHFIQKTEYSFKIGKGTTFGCCAVLSHRLGGLRPHFTQQISGLICVPLSPGPEIQNDPECVQGWMGPWAPWSGGWWWNQVILKVPSHPDHSVIPWCTSSLAQSLKTNHIILCNPKYSMWCSREPSHSF